MVQEIAQEIIRSARKKGTQDIYFVPKLDAYELHMRVGDERCKIGSYDFEKFAAVISHFKFVAGMNVGEKRRSQLGSCDYAYDHKIASLRLSTVGDYRGHESLVIRLLHDEEQDLHFWFQDIEELGKQYRQRGLYLFAGPVGSGKTTLMHELSKSLFKGQQVMSIEDPVEIKQDDMLQLQLNEAIGLTYENLIKLSLRHRPDLLIIGEIRDSETARAVVRASLTGATVFSTIHAKSIRGVYERLLELGVSEEELAVVLQGVCYQRLIGGGGIVDFASRDYQEHQAAKWNEQIDQLLKDGHITSLQAETEKLATAKQKNIITLFNNLFSSGFHLVETISFLDRSALLDKQCVTQMRVGLSQGKSFSEMMESLGCSSAIVTQLSLAEVHGNLHLSLGKIEEYLDNLAKVKKKLIEVATYPLILLGFLLLIMLGLRNYLLPQLDSSNIATQIIGNLPQIFLGMVGLVSVLALLALTFYKRSSKMSVFSILARLPFIGIFVQTYLTAYYAREWGNMISQGMELTQIFQMMQEQGSQLFKEVGQDLAQTLKNGREFSQTIGTYPFFRKELSLIIEYGEVKSKLGSELEIYAEKTWEAFFTRVNRTMNLVQPLVFIFVALIIVLLYAAMLMPMYQNMEVNF
ncbi:bacterial type II secretion system F domain protein [Streptococcus pneumoniae SPAR48]|nr:bacterial type II secretion system F domain protein [Streptococcus pneumoniae SPAR48]